MEYRDELRQKILGEDPEAPPARRRLAFGRKRSEAAPAPKRPAEAAPEPRAATTPAPEAAKGAPGPRFSMRANWDARVRARSGEDGEPERARRAERAARRLRRAYSPLRILLLLAFMPVTAASLTLSIYIATSPFEPGLALGHLVAMGGCESAASVGLAPAPAGMPGYHSPLDTDGNGVACQPADLALAGHDMPGTGGPVEVTGGAKFLRP